MGRTPKNRDIRAYLWHAKPVQVNSTNDNWRIRYAYLDSEGKEHQTTETVNSANAKEQFVSYLTLREKEYRSSKKSGTPPPTYKTSIITVEQLMYAYAEHTKYLHRVGDKYGWDETTYRANIGKIRK